MANKYYAKENRLHKELRDQKLSPMEAIKLTQWLCEQVAVKPPFVTIMDKEYSETRFAKKQIAYSSTDLNKLTVIHEVAHWLQFKGGKHIKSIRWHNRQHSILVDLLARLV